MFVLLPLMQNALPTAFSRHQPLHENHFVAFLQVSVLDFIFGSRLLNLLGAVLGVIHSRFCWKVLPLMAGVFGVPVVTVGDQTDCLDSPTGILQNQTQVATIARSICYEPTGWLPWLARTREPLFRLFFEFIVEGGLPTTMYVYIQSIYIYIYIVYTHTNRKNVCIYIEREQKERKKG